MKTSTENRITPFYFEKNITSIDPQVKFFSKCKDCSIFFMSKEILFCFFDIVNGIRIPDIMRLKFKKCHAHKPIGYEELNNNSDNLSKTSDSSEHTFEKIIYKNIYNDIDVIFYNKDFMINCDFIINPYADYRNITMDFIEYCSLSVDEFGNLVINMPLEREIIIMKPIAYQDIDNHKINIECNYKLKNRHVQFTLGKYNKKYKLIINPNVR